MKKIKIICLSLALATVGLQSNAFIKINKTTVVTESTTTSTNGAVNASSTNFVVDQATVSSVNKDLKAPAKGGDAKLSKGIYILLAFLGLGWLGMGLNDNFEGTDWIISLVLYLLFWLPGFIYTLVKMKKYYN